MNQLTKTEYEVIKGFALKGIDEAATPWMKLVVEEMLAKIDPSGKEYVRTPEQIDKFLQGIEDVQAEIARVYQAPVVTQPQAEAAVTTMLAPPTGRLTTAQIEAIKLNDRANGKKRTYTGWPPKPSIDALGPVALFADGLTSYQVAANCGISPKQAGHIKGSYYRMIEELSKIPHGQQRYNWLRENFIDGRYSNGEATTVMKEAFKKAGLSSVAKMKSGE